MSAMPTISLCMIVRNEAASLERCLDSVQGVVSEMIVLDTGSTDDTVDVARRCGAQVYHHPWDDDFAAARNVSLGHAAGDWILCLDADETLDEQARAALRRLLPGTQALAYYLTFRSPVEGGGAGSVIQSLHPRLFRNHRGIRFEGRIHEEIVQSVLRAGGGIEQSGIVITHAGYTPEIFQNRDKFERNVRILHKDIADRPTFGMNHFYLGENFSLQHRWPEAIDAYRRGIEVGNIPPANLAVLHQNLGTALLHSGQPTEALHAEAESLRCNPEQTTPHVVAAQAAFEEKNWDKVIWELTGFMQKVQSANGQAAHLVQHEPNFPFIFHLLAHACLYSRNYEAAEQWFTRLLEVAPDSIEGQCGKAAALTGRGEYREAETCVRRSLDRYGEREDLLTALGAIYAAEKDWPAAESAFRKACEKAPQNAAIRAELAKTLFHRQQYPDVVRLLDTLAPESIPLTVQMQLAQSYFYIGKIQQSRRLLETLTRETACACEALCLLGSLEEATGGTRAVEYFRRAAKAAGGTAALYCLSGNKLLQNGAYTDAMNALQQAHQLEPLAREPLHNMAVTNIKNNKLESAVENFETLLKIHPEDHNTKRKLAGLYAKLGDRPRAEKLLGELEDA